MERYKEYKDSGVQWIGQIPSHWNLRRLKTIATCNDESLTENYDQDKEIEYVEIGDVDSINGIKNYTKYKFKEAPSRARRITKVGDVIISTVRTYLKAIAYIKEPDLIVSTGFAVLRPTNICPEYLAYSSMCDGFTNEVLRYSIGISYPAISSNDLLRLKVPLPPLDEQEKIVSYIESKTSKIDEYIAEKEKEVQLLNELKEAEIAKVVTQGLNPNVRMKDSGISWIGMIPEHWDITKISSLFSERREKVSDKDYPALSVSKVGITPQLETAVKTDNGDNRKKVCIGDFVVNSRSDRKGSCGVSPYTGSVSLINIVLQPRTNKIEGQYYHYLFRSNNYIEEYYRLGRGIVADLWTTRYSEMRNIMIPLPPLDEQRAIVAYINEKIAKVESLITDLQAEIDYLKEYKQRLIADCVTGQVNVQNV